MSVDQSEWILAEWLYLMGFGLNQWQSTNFCSLHYDTLQYCIPHFPPCGSAQSSQHALMLKFMFGHLAYQILNPHCWHSTDCFLDIWEQAYRSIILQLHATKVFPLMPNIPPSPSLAQPLCPGVSHVNQLSHSLRRSHKAQFQSEIICCPSSRESFLHLLRWTPSVCCMLLHCQYSTPGVWYFNKLFPFLEGSVFITNNCGQLVLSCLLHATCLVLLSYKNMHPWNKQYHTIPLTCVARR